MQEHGLTLFEPWYINFAWGNLKMNCDFSWPEECTSRVVKIARGRAANILNILHLAEMLAMMMTVKAAKW